MGKDHVEDSLRRDRLQDTQRAFAQSVGAGVLSRAERLRQAAAAHDVKETTNPNTYRGRCPCCKRPRVFVVRLDANGDVQRKCFKGCSTAEIQQAAPVQLSILKACPLPGGWNDDGSEHAAGLWRWWLKHGDADDAQPRRRDSVRRVLYAIGAASSRAGSPEIEPAVSSLALDAGRDPRRLRGRGGIIAWVLALRSQPVTRLRTGGVERRAGRRVLRKGAYRVNIPPAGENVGPSSLPNVAPGGNTARGIGGETWRTLDAWPMFGRAATTHKELATLARLSHVTAKRHVRLFLDLGLAVEVDGPPSEAGGRAQRGRPAKWYTLTAEAAAAIERGDDFALAALARLAPERQNLRGKAARKIGQQAQAFARAILSPTWGWRNRAAAAAAAATAGDVAELEAWRTRPAVVAPLEHAAALAATMQPAADDVAASGAAPRVG